MLKMPFLFIILLGLWLVSVGYRVLSTVVIFGYAAGVARAYWGLRYFQEHIIIEAVVVLALGVAVGLTVHYAKNRKQYIASVCGFIALPLLVVFHFVAMEWKIGYQTRVSIAGELHAVDWKYSPSVAGGKSEEQSLHIKTTLPGYNAIYDERPEIYLRLEIAKSEKRDMVYSSIFSSGSNAPDTSECVEEPYNRYCRVYSEGAWYFTHHQNFEESKSHLFPTIDEFERKLPELFESFIERDQSSR